MKWREEHKKNAREFAGALAEEGYDFFTGVPCSLLGALIERLSEDRKSPYVPAVREDAAIGMASGAYLAGRKPVVLMQNSGLGYSLNVLTSLNLIYRIPVLCLVSYRGLGPDAPEHLVMGRSCEKILDEVGIKSAVAGEGELIPMLRAATQAMSGNKQPYAIFIKKGIFGA